MITTKFQVRGVVQIRSIFGDRKPDNERIFFWHKSSSVYLAKIIKESRVMSGKNPLMY